MSLVGNALFRDMPKVDCHCHVFDPAGFPYVAHSPYHPAGAEIGTADQIGHVFAAHGIGHALLVQPNSGYMEDNRCMLAAIAASGGRYRGVAVVPHDISIEALADLKAQGIVGVAFNLPFFRRGHYAGTEALLEKLHALGMILQVQVEGDMLLDILPMLTASPVQLVFDHCGRPLPGRGPDQPGFRELLDLGRTGRAAVKLSGLIKCSEQAFPFADAHVLVAALLEAFGPDACVWGSDWPFLRARERLDYGPLLNLFAHLVPEPDRQRAILWNTPRRLFGFGD